MKNLLREAFPADGVLRASTVRGAAARAKLYVIFLTPRSGSTWLTELAMKTATLGTPQEWFNDGWVYTDEPALGCLPPRRRGIADINRYVDAIVDEGPGVAGLELSVYQALMLRDLLDGPIDPAWLTASFYLRRRDIVSQAVSLYRSAASGRFHSYQNTAQHRRAFDTVAYDHDSLVNWLAFLIDSEQKFDALFGECRLAPIPLFYEDLQADPLGTLRTISHGLGIAPPHALPSTTLEIMRDETSALWRERLVRDLPPELAASVESRLQQDVTAEHLPSCHRGILRRAAR